MVEKALCEHCGAECRHPVTKVIDGRPLNFCCSGCLQVYEFLREEVPLPGQSGPPAQGRPQAERLGDVEQRVGAGLPSRTVRLPILGMTCANCVAHVEGSLRGVPGVMQASVSLADERATVRFDSQQTSIDQMVAAVRGAGYDVAVDRVNESQ